MGNVIGCGDTRGRPSSYSISNRTAGVNPLTVKIAREQPVILSGMVAAMAFVVRLEFRHTWEK